MTTVGTPSENSEENRPISAENVTSSGPGRGAVNAPENLSDGFVLGKSYLGGPIPDPETLEKYEKLLPGSGKKLLEQALEERERIARIQIENIEAKVRVEAFGIRAQASPRFIPFLIAILGAASAVTTLLLGYTNFVSAVQKLFYSKQFSLNLLISPAYAEGTTQSTAPLVPVLPIFAYLVYALLAIAYLVTLYMSFQAKEANERSTAYDIFKNLNAFFIGAITGKIT